MLKKIFIFLFILLIFGSFVNAAGLCDPCTDPSECEGGLECIDERCRYVCPSGETCIQNPLKACSFQDLIDSIINFIFWVSLVLAPLMIVIAGFYWLTAAGDLKRVETAKKIILWACIGLAIILFAKGLISVIEHILGP